MKDLVVQKVLTQQGAQQCLTSFHCQRKTAWTPQHAYGIYSWVADDLARCDILEEVVGNEDDHNHPLPHPIPSDAFVHSWFQEVSVAQMGVV